MASSDTTSNSSTGGAARSMDYGGAGIGLIISKALSEAHSGALTTTSSGPGRGAVLTLRASHCPLPTVRRLLGDHALPRVRTAPSTP